MKRRLLWPGVVVVLFAAIIAFAVWRDAEPALRGQPLSYWIEPWRSKAETPESVAAAHAEMDAAHVRWLIRQMDWRPSKVRKIVARAVNSLGDIMSSQTQDDRREVVAGALGRLGERARPAIPALRKMTTTTVEPWGWEARCAATAALIRLGEAPLEPHLAVLRDAAHTNWLLAADVVARLETNVAEAADIFESMMRPGNPPGVRARAMLLYRHVQHDIARVLHMATLALDSPPTRVQGLYALQALGTNAAPAAPAVRALLTDTNAEVRRTAAATLLSIVGVLAQQP